MKEFEYRRNIMAVAVTVMAAASAVSVLFFFQVDRARDAAQKAAVLAVDEAVERLRWEIRLGGVPVGSVVRFAGWPAMVPERWLICDGRRLHRVKYPELSTSIGLKYGGTDEEFQLPDLRGNDDGDALSIIKVR